MEVTLLALVCFMTQAKRGKAELLRDRSMGKYRAALHSLEQDRARYQSDMMQVFKASQSSELERIKFFAQIWAKLEKALIIDYGAKDQVLARAHSVIDADTDLSIFAQKSGPASPLIVPQFMPWSSATSPTP
jgi:excinuclease UvrABC helicase subunit UvrB